MFTTPEIVDAVARVHGVTVQELCGASRLRHIVIARQQSYHIAKTHAGENLSQIGRAMNRDHTTVQAGLSEYNARPERQEREADVIALLMGRPMFVSTRGKS